METKVLDHGYVRYIEHWGADFRIIEAARQSVGGGFVSWNAYEDHPRGDTGLLNYLYTHKHFTPFEMAGLVLEVQAPIFVFREWHRHRTQSYNEMSARYVPMPNTHYMPTLERITHTPGGANRQATGVATVATEKDLTRWLQRLSDLYDLSEQCYQEGLLLGVPKEIARCAVLVSRYSRMRVSTNLRNWLQFLELREAENAQWEIRQFAAAVAGYLTVKFPRTMALYRDR